MRNRYSQILVRFMGSILLIIISSTCADTQQRPAQKRVADSTDFAKASATAVSITSPIQFAFNRIQTTAESWRPFSNSMIDLPSRPVVSRSLGPLRVIHLIGGDRISAEIVEWNPDTVQLRLQNRQVVTVARAAITEISVPAGEVELLAESFESTEPSTSSPPSCVGPRIDPAWLDESQVMNGVRSLNIFRATEALVYRFTGLIPSSRTQFWFSTRPENSETGADPVENPSLDVEFEFTEHEGMAVTSKWSLRFSPQTVRMASTSKKGAGISQGISLRTGWHCLTAVCLPDRSFVTIDDKLLGSLTVSPGKLSAVRFAATGPAWIDDLQFSSLESARSLPCPFQKVDCVMRHDNDDWFGHVSAVTSQGIRLTSPGEDRLTAWGDVNKILFEQPLLPLQEQSLMGLWSGIEFQPCSDRPYQSADRIRGVITDVNRDYLVVTHPWLREICIGWKQVSRIDLDFYGLGMAIDARRLHLGDAIRIDFHRPLPDGTEWRGEFQLPSACERTCQCWMVLDVADLEPAGPGTPPASPFLKELRAGKLKTEFIVNDQVVGDLNSQIRFRASPDNPERIRLRIPSRLLNSGRNTFRLQQTPLNNSGAGFDNCELSNLRLEMVPNFDHR